MSKEQILIGSTNQGKLREIESLLAPLGLEVIPADPLEIEETGKTLLQNAMLKAMAYSRANPGKTVICEDSGLVVPYLNSLPGIYSGRFYSVTLDDNLNVVDIPSEDFTNKEEHAKLNNQRLLSLVKERCNDYQSRSAFFEVQMVVMKDMEILDIESGISLGHIIDEERGANGFGYDSIFVGEDTGNKTYAELNDEEKNLVSFRGKALEGLKLFFMYEYSKQ